MEYKVKRIFNHSDYNHPFPLNNDIAMFELQRPIQFNKYVRPVCLPDADVHVGKECYITGKEAILSDDTLWGESDEFFG